MEKIEFLSAVIIISKDMERLVGFYRDVIGLPLEGEEHGGTKKHYGCELGHIHFAIHPPENFEDHATGTGSTRLAFTTFDVSALAKRIESHGHKLVFGPKDTGFAQMIAVHDPDGNYVEFTQLSDRWFQYLEKKNSDVVSKWKSLKL
jgi:predicted enzyme related to lactoylglutathione lyase